MNTSHLQGCAEVESQEEEAAPPTGARPAGVPDSLLRDHPVVRPTVSAMPGPQHAHARSTTWRRQGMSSSFL